MSCICNEIPFYVICTVKYVHSVKYVNSKNMTSVIALKCPKIAYSAG